MIDYHKEIVNALNTVGLPVHYEMFLHSGLQTPCISYMEISNIDERNGDTHGYSRISYQVKLWAQDIAVLQSYIHKIDKAMRALGFRRSSSAELHDPNSAMLQKVLTYEVIAYEEY
jgi:hypothetical protein